METPISAKTMEENCLDQYKEQEKSFPPWNYQENKKKFGSLISVAFGIYKQERAK